MQCDNLLLQDKRLTALYDRQEPTFSSHLWILGELLTSRGDPLEDQLARLYKYILSMCCRKMNYRLQSSKSLRYVRSLEGVREFTFKPKPVGESSTNKTPHDLRREKEEIINDRKLLAVMQLAASSAESNTFPNMLQVAKGVASNSEAPFDLYTNATCIEFHRLLINLLVGFRETVANLSKQSKLAMKKDSTFSKTAFEQDLSRGRTFGYALMRMARGRAFRMHMENIEFLLSDTRTDIEASALAPEGEQEGGDEDGEDGGGGNEDDECEDEELEATMATNKWSLSESYGAWLRLMVIHFDAIEILVSFVNGTGKSYEAISIKILIPPTTTPKVLPWSELFTYPYLFPAIDAQNPNSITKSNAEIKQFLEDAIDNAKFASDSYALARKVQTSWNSGQLNAARDALSKLTSLSPSPSPRLPETHNAVRLLINIQKKKKNQETWTKTRRTRRSSRKSSTMVSMKYVLYTANQLPSTSFTSNSPRKTLSLARYIVRPIWPAYWITSPSTSRSTQPMWKSKHCMK